MPTSNNRKRRPPADTLSFSDSSTAYSSATTSTTTSTATTTTTSSDGSERSSYSYYSSGSSSVAASADGAGQRLSHHESSHRGGKKVRESVSSSFDITSTDPTSSPSSSSSSTGSNGDGSSTVARGATKEAQAWASSAGTSSHGSSADKLPPSLPFELSRRISRTTEAQTEAGGPGEAMLPLEVVKQDPVLSQGAIVPIYGPPPKRNPSVVTKITTQVLQLPPTDAMLEQRRQDGCMPYPSRLTYRMVARPNMMGDAIPIGDQQEQDIGAAADDQAKLRARHEKADAACCCSSMTSKRFWKRRNVVEDRDAARQHINKTVLRGHHVPLVPFVTQRQEDPDRLGAPTVEEARRIHEHGVRHMPDTSDPMSVAMRKNRDRPSNIFVIKTSHSMGGETVRHCARSNFLQPDEPVAFWMTQLQQRPQLLLGEIEESEVFSIASEVSRLSEGDRLLDEPEQLARLEHRIKQEQAKIEEEQHLATSMADDAGALTVPSGNVHYYVDPVYGTRYDPSKKTRSLLSSLRSSTASSDSGDATAEESVRQAQETKRRLQSISPPRVAAPPSTAHSPFGFSGS